MMLVEGLVDPIVRYSFLGSAYLKTTPEELRLSLWSLSCQTLLPAQVVLVLDGPVLPETEIVAKEYSRVLPIELIYLKANCGLARALNEGLKRCTNEFVLRFDTDDICQPFRAEVQLRYLNDKDYDIVGSYVYEFHDSPFEMYQIRKVPLTSFGILIRALYRNPFNHPSVAFRRSLVISKLGGYSKVDYYEDYDLWIRAISSRSRVANIDQCLVGMKVSGQASRRQGLRLIAGEMNIMRTMLLRFSLFAPIIALTFIARIALRILPTSTLSFIYQKFLRT